MVCSALPPPDTPGESGGIKVKIKDLHFYYGSSEVLKGIDLDIPDRRVTAIIGSSGCGKSTLLRCINRIYALHPDRHATGEVSIDGRNTLLLSQKDLLLLRLQVGMIFQSPTPFPMSIYDNVAFGLRLWEELQPRELDERVEQALRCAALWDEAKDILKKRATALSGGQQQRLCIARAIAVNPEVLLMDEPCSSLDPVSTARIEELIEELKSEYCVIIVTHNMHQAGRCSDYTAFMHEGKLIEFGKTEQVMNRPQNQQTEDYIEGRFRLITARDF